jgi:hypothetical protein
MFIIYKKGVETMKKRIVVALTLLVVMLCFSLTACSPSNGTYKLTYMKIDVGITTVEIDTKKLKNKDDLSPVEKSALGAFEELQIQIEKKEIIFLTAGEEEYRVEYKMEGNKMIFIEKEGEDHDDMFSGAETKFTYGFGKITIQIESSGMSGTLEFKK